MADDHSAEIEGLKNRIRELGKKKAELAAELRSMKDENDALQAKASTADTLASQLERATADLATARQSAEWTDAMLDAGVMDSSGRDFLSYQYSRLGDDRPEFAKWLGQRKEGATGFEASLFQADPGRQQQQQQQQQQQTDQGQQQQQQPRRGVTTGGAHNGARGGLSWQQILDPNTPTDQALGGGPGGMPWTQPYQS